MHTDERPEEPLPDALPPLDDNLLRSLVGEGEDDDGPAHRAGSLTLFGQARVRGELDDSRDLSRRPDTRLGAALTARVGLEGSYQLASTRLVIGDGGRLGPASTAPVLVDTPQVPFVYEAALRLDLDVIGLPATFAVGRMPVVLGDGRFFGTEPWDARGRTLDGARVDVRARLADVSLGAFALHERSFTLGRLSGVLFAAARLSPTVPADVELYAWLHRDAELPGSVTTPHAGARVRKDLSLGLASLALRAGADAQLHTADDGDAFSVKGSAGHGEVGARAGLLALGAQLFLDVSTEVTGGSPIANRVLLVPAPSQHGALGDLDMLAADNTWSTAIAIGGVQGRGLALDLVGRATGALRDDASLVRPDGAPLPIRSTGLAFLELDAHLAVPVAAGTWLMLGYALGGAPGPAWIGELPAQRFTVALQMNVDNARSADSAHPPPL